MLKILLHILLIPQNIYSYIRVSMRTISKPAVSTLRRVYSYGKPLRFFDVKHGRRLFFIRKKPAKISLFKFCTFFLCVSRILIYLFILAFSFLNIGTTLLQCLLDDTI